MVYFISGLGADERVFQFLDLPKIEKKFIRWVRPEKNENIANYCQKLIAQIDVQKEVNLVGISFGGIIAQEIAKLIPCKKIIIISSVKLTAEFNWQLKFASHTKIYQIIPLWLLQLGNKLTANYYFGVQTVAESILLYQIIVDTDPVFLKWAINQVMNWKNTCYPENLIHIHGTRDKIFPIKHIQTSVEIPNGGHFMIVNKADKLSALIFDYLKEESHEH